jgi:spermidine/putrescine transport system permease protein
MINVRKYSSLPYVVWSIIFIVVPLILIFAFSFFTKTAAGIQFNLESYKKFFQPEYLKVIYLSFQMAFKATIICILIGYPFAYLLTRFKARKQKILLILMILPMWMNFLLRTYSWMAILGKKGFLNRFLMFMNLPTVDLIYNEGAVLLGMVYNFLPFMILPIFTVLSKIDQHLIEAAVDLGADKKTVFIKIIFPLSLPGLLSGIAMVFMPAISAFVIPALLGGGQFMLIGNLVEQQFMRIGNWSFGSAMSVILMILILISMGIINKYADKGNGVSLW